MLHTREVALDLCKRIENLLSNNSLARYELKGALYKLQKYEKNLKIAKI